MANEGESEKDTPWEFKPGETISPASIPVQSSPAAPEPPQTPPQAVEAQPEPSSQFTFPGNRQTDFVPAVADEPLISWTASEFIRHEKSTDWYLALLVVDVVIAVLVYLMFRDLVTTIVVVVAGIGFAVYGGWMPKQQAYGLSETGVTIGQRFFAYAEFRSFSIMDEGAITSIQLTPLKRFGTPVTMYYDPKDEEAILQLLSKRLPIEEAKRDAVDAFIKRIRF